jgi:hypothetical protein
MIAAGWAWTRPTEVLRQMVIRRGVISAPHFKSQLENLIIPGALNAMGPLWRPKIEIIDRTLSAEDDADKPTVAPELSTLSFPLHPTNPEQTATLTALLQNRINDLAADSIALAEVENNSTHLALNQSLSRAQRAFTLVSDEQYVETLRGEIERIISLTEAAIRRQNALHESLTKRYASLTDRIALLQGGLDRLLSSMDESASTYPGMSQVVADRVTSMRMELENHIPAERVQLIKNLESSQARVDELEASLKQERLRFNTFETDIADRQANAQMAIEAASAALTKYQAQSAAKLVAQPLTIVEEFDLTEKKSNRLLFSFGVLILGGLSSLLSAYLLEGVRLARMGATQG